MYIAEDAMKCCILVIQSVDIVGMIILRGSPIASVISYAYVLKFDLLSVYYHLVVVFIVQCPLIASELKSMAVYLLELGQLID